MAGRYGSISRHALVIAACVVSGCAAPRAGDPLQPYEVVGDAVPLVLESRRGDPESGRKIMAGRDANCLLCHAVPETGERFMGNIGPPLSGIGGRLSAAQLRLRIIDQSRLNRDTVMPSYYRVDGLNRVAEAWRGKPILTAQQIEDVIAYLQTLR